MTFCQRGSYKGSQGLVQYEVARRSVSPKEGWVDRIVTVRERLLKLCQETFYPRSRSHFQLTPNTLQTVIFSFLGFEKVFLGPSFSLNVLSPMFDVHCCFFCFLLPKEIRKSSVLLIHWKGERVGVDLLQPVERTYHL